MNAITNAYNYYMTTYTPKQSKDRYGAHKPGELKEIYNSIVKMNTESPTYLYDRSASVYKYAINIKEEALGLKDALTALTNESDPSSIIGKKIATSDNTDVIDVSYIGNNSSDDSSTSYEIEVSNLAKPQINTGNFLPKDNLGLLPNDYSFELKTTSAAYEFQFHISHNDTNQSIMTRLSNLINNSDIGVSSTVLTDDNDRCALEITSDNTGNPTVTNENMKDLFEIKSTNDNLDDVVNYFGLDNTTQLSENADFTLDGEPHSSASNTFSINNIFEVTLKQTTEDETPVHIGFKTDTDTIADNIKALVKQYNSMVDTASQYTTVDKVQSHSLFKDLNNLTTHFHNTLESIGLNTDDNGNITVDDSLLYQALEEDTDDTVQTIFNYKSALVNKTNNIVLNPMNYVNRTIVTYPNPAKALPNPYVTSMYSGMLFNSYC